MFRYITSKVSKDGIVESLCLAVCLTTVYFNCQALDDNQCEYYWEELAYKTGAVVSHQVRRYTKWDEPLGHE